MKKYLAALFVIITVLLSFASCTVDSDGGTVDGENAGTQNGVKDKILVLFEDDKENDVAKLISGIMYSSGALIDRAESGSSADVTIGRVDADISKFAYTILTEKTERLSGVTGWVIYSNGEQLAFAYDSDYAFIEGAEKLLSLYDGRVPSYAKGVVAQDVFSVSGYVDGLRQEEQDKRFANLEDYLGQEATDYIRNMYSLYGSELYFWVANLYDPDAGGFYYSNSARNNAGYLPDLESTGQIIDWIQSTGMLAEYDNDIKNAFSEKTKSEIVGFARDLQDSEDGYFYHPQWGKMITESRRGRDLTWATKIFRTFGELPYYNTPSGLVGSGAPYVLSARLRSGTSSAVSRVIATSASSLPSYLKDLTKWDSYITSLKIQENSYHGGSTLDAISSQIKTAGQEYIDHLIYRLNDMQYDEGMWESPAKWAASDENKYNAVNGIMKIVSTYNNFGKQIQNAEAAIQRCIDVILIKEGDLNICYVYNPWVSISVLVKNVEDYGGSEQAKAIYSELRADAASLVGATLKKMIKYKKKDGGFSFLPEYSSPISQDAPVAPPETVESDVNASTIASTGIISCMFSSFALTKVPLYYSDDTRLFLSELAYMDTIIKNDGGTSISSDGTITFDGYTPESGRESYGVSLLPANGVQNQINDNELNDDMEYAWFSSVPVKDPVPENENDLALRTEVFTRECTCGKPAGECTCKKVGREASSTYFSFASSDEGNRYVFETDLYFESGLWTIGQMFFNAKKGSSSPVTLTITALENKTVNISGKDENGASKNVVTGLPMGEWINLRLELYKIYDKATDENGNEQNVLSTVKVKLFINDVYRGECNGDASNEFDISYFNYSYYRHFASAVWFDNVQLERDDEPYVSEEPEKEITAIFDNYKENLKPAVNGVVAKPSDLVETLVNDKELDENGNYKWLESTVVSDPLSQTEGDLVLKTVTKVASCTCGLPAEECKCKKTASVASATYYKLLETSADGNCYVFSGDFFFESGLWTIGQISFIKGKGQASSVTLNVTANENNTVTLSCPGTDFSATVPMGEWVNLKFELYKIYDESGNFVSNTVKVFVGGKYKAEFSTKTDTPIAYVAYFYYRSFASTVYFDNILAEKISRDFVSDEPEKETVAIFDKYIEERYPAVNGVVTKPSDLVETLVNDKELDENGNYKWLESTVVSDPLSQTEGDLVLKTVTKVAPCTCGLPAEECKCKKTANVASATYYKLLETSADGNCYVFSGDFFFESGLYTIGQISFIQGKGQASSVTLNVTANKDNTVTVSCSGFSATVPMGEWVNLKFELYKIYDADGNFVSNTVKVFVGGKYKAEFSTKTDTPIAYVAYFYYRSFASTVYFDNILAEKISRDFVSDEPEKETVAIFDKYIEERYPAVNGVVTKPSDLVETLVNDKELDENGNYKWLESTVVSDPLSQTEGDLVLKTVTKVASCTCGLSAEECKCKKTANVASATFFRLLQGDAGNTYIFDFDVYFESGLWTIGQMYFTPDNKTAWSGISLNVTANQDSTVQIGAVKNIPMKEWVDITIELYKIYSEDGTFKKYIGKIFVNGSYSGEFNGTTDVNINAFCYSYYRSFESTVYFDNASLIRCNKEYKMTVPVADFEDGDTTVTGVVTSPDTGVSTKAHATYTSESRVVEDPDSDRAGNLVLKTVNKPGLIGSVAAAYTSFAVSGSEGNTYILDMDIRIDYAKWNIARIYFGTDFGSTNYIAIDDGLNFGSVEGVMSLNTWTRVRIEVYNIYADGEYSETKVKIYSDNIYKGELSYSSELTPSAFSLRYLNLAGTGSDNTVYLDNISAYRTDTAYISGNTN